MTISCKTYTGVLVLVCIMHYALIIVLIEDSINGGGFP